MRLLLSYILLLCLFSGKAFAIKGEAAEALIYEFLYNQMGQERKEKAGVKKMHPEGFYKICASGSLEEVEKAIKDGADPKIPDADRGQTTALHDAAAFNPDARVTALLMKKGADVNAQGNLNKRTALHIAVAVNPNAAAIIKELAKGKPDYYLLDTDGLNPFQAAIRGSVDPETRSYRVPDESVLLAILDANTAYAKDSDGYKPIEDYFSRFEGGVLNPKNLRPSAKVLERLIKGGCNINTSVRRFGSKEPLLFKAISFDSAGKGQEDTLTRLFFKNGADIYATSDSGKQSVHKVAFYGNSTALKTLLSFDTKKTLARATDEFAETPLHILARWQAEDLPACGKLLLAAGADINAHDDHGNTAFLLVAKDSSLPAINFENDEHYKRGTAKRKKAVEFLLANGADVKIVDSKGRNPLHKLCDRQVLSKPDLEMFIEAGVNLDSRDNDGNTPLMLFVISSSDSSAYYNSAADRLAAFTRNLPILKALGADPAIKNKAGKVAYDFLHKDFLEKAKNETAFLHVVLKNKPTLFNVCEKGCDEKTIQAALAKGMDIDPVDAKTGITPLHKVVAQGDEKSAKALIAYGAPLEKTANDGETPLGIALKKDQYEIATG